MRRAAARISSSSTPQRSRVVGDRHVAQRGEHRLGAVDVLGEERVVDEVLLDERRRERGQAPGVAARAHAQVEVGELRGVGHAPGR